MADKLAFLFPGQGQLPASVPPLSSSLEALYARVEEPGLMIREWVRSDRAERLLQTDAAQPTVFLDSLARCDLLAAGGLAPAVVAGHSLGEYAALVAAGVLSPGDALDLVLERGRRMAAVSGGMTAVVKLPETAVATLCASVGRGAVVANYNAAEQFVISAPVDVLAEIERRVTELGGRAIRLRVSGPFHSPAMQTAQDALAPRIRAAAFSPPRLAFVSSVSGRHESDARVLRELLARQITSPVRWADVLRALPDLGVTHAVEIGEGNVLTQLGRRAGIPLHFSTFEEVAHV